MAGPVALMSTLTYENEGSQDYVTGNMDFPVVHHK